MEDDPGCPNLHQICKSDVWWDAALQHAAGPPSARPFSVFLALPALLCGASLWHYLPLLFEPWQVHKAKLRCERQRRRDRPFLRPVWDLLRGGHTADLAPGR